MFFIILRFSKREKMSFSKQSTFGSKVFFDEVSSANYEKLCYNLLDKYSTEFDKVTTSQ